MCLQGFEHSIPLPPIIFPCLLNMTSISFPNLLELSFIVVLAFPKASSIGFICNDNHRFSILPNKYDVTFVINTYNTDI